LPENLTIEVSKTALVGLFALEIWAEEVSREALSGLFAL
jgi:hypothetical protein